jgi:hypothetical protein
MASQESPDVKVNEVVLDLQITEGVGPLSAAEVKRIVMLVLEQVHNEQHRMDERTRDTRINDRAFRPEPRI